MKNVSDKSRREKTRVLCSITFFFENRTIFEIMLKNVVEPDRPQMTMWRIACWIPLATNTYSAYVILIAFPQQQWLHERASMLRCAYIFCVVSVTVALRILTPRIRRLYIVL